MSKVQTPQAWEVVDKEFREIKEWFLLNRLLLNEDKTQTLVCTLISEPVEDSTCTKRLHAFVVLRLTRIFLGACVQEVGNKLSRVVFLLR